MKSIESIYGRIRKIYRESGMSQSDFAKELGVSASYVCKIVNGTLKAEQISKMFLLLICDRFGYNLEWITTGQGPERPEGQVKEEQAPYLDDLNRRIIAEMAGLSVETRRAILEYVKERRFFAELMKSKPEEGVGK